MSLSENLGVTRHHELAAQVIFTSSEGKAPSGDEAITAANVKSFAPSPQSVRHATDALRKLGFVVSPVVGNSMSIAAPISTFEKAFGVSIADTGDKGILFEPDTGKRSRELPDSLMPRALRKDVYKIVFTEPPDFGPRQFDA